MWSVFIADDEPKIRRRLRRMVESYSDDFQVCGEAEDGIDAMERIGDELPDILLIDICMPRLNGLDFIEKIGDEAANSIIIVVSGHDEFEYAQRAIQLPIFEYVLKPVDALSLKETFSRATEVLKKKQKKNELLQWAEQEVRQSHDELVQELFDDWIRGFSSPEEIEERKRVLSCNFPSPATLLGIQLNAFCYGITALEIREHKVLKLAVKKLVEDTLGNDTRRFFFEDEKDHMFFLVQGSLSDEETESLRLNIRARLNLPVRTGVTLYRPDYEDFINDYEALCLFIDDRNRDAAIIRKIQLFLEENYKNQNLNLEAAASELSLSRGYISRLLKQQTGYSFSEFTNRFRVLEAIRLMNGSDKLMYEIADEVGYASQHYFSRIFKQIIGQSPGDYRKAQVS